MALESEAKKPNILVIDDNRSWCEFLAVALEDVASIVFALNGAEGLRFAQTQAPDCILLDIAMPDKNGYDVCCELKGAETTAAIPIIFLSGKDSLEEKIFGFEIGAEDYLLKSKNLDMLKIKIQRAVTAVKQVHQLNALAENAQAVAFDALSGSADLGRSLRFAERTYTMSSFEKLAEGLIQTMNEFGLRISLMFMSTNGQLFYGQKGVPISPLERTMFIACHKEGRFCDYGERTFCNFSLVSMLIKNMPLDEPERYGRIKDTIPWVLGATDAKVYALNHQHQLQATLAQQQLLVSAVKEQCVAQLSQENQLPQALQSMQDLLVQLQGSQALMSQEIMQGGSCCAEAGELANNEIYSSDVDLF